ncbi:MAG: hypothetical protein WB764_21960 [Xanthobacteraceae bacterium]
MKVFWAWQADTPGKISRHFVRQALEDAIDRLRQPKDIEEPPEEARRANLHIDHDTKGLRGSPEIAHEIFKKIAASEVLVADVTPVGSSAATSASQKSLMNPNVAIELGYAFGKIGTDRFLPVLNLAFGDVADLPFDIAHRRRPIVYNLLPTASPHEIEEEKRKLTTQFITALEPYIIGQETNEAVTSFAAAPAKIGKAIYFADGEILRNVQHLNRKFVMPFREVFYLRVQPRTSIDGHLDVRKLRNNALQYGNFDFPGGGGDFFVGDNQYGVIAGTVAGNTNDLDNVVQYFRTGEIWAINAGVLREGERDNHRYVFTQPLEDILVFGLRSALLFEKQVSHIEPPFYVEVGIVGVAGREIAHSGFALTGREPVLASNEITHHAVLNRADDQTVAAFLMEFFEKLNRDSGVSRPKGLYGRQ